MRRLLAERGWVEATTGRADLWWEAYLPDPAAYADLRPGSRINHLPGIAVLFHKDQLHRQLDFARRRAGAEGRDGWDFVPETYVLPRQRPAWEAAADADPTARWILKPPQGARSEGLTVVAGPAAAPPDEDRLAQRYLDRPLLLARHPHKHVLRVYVAVTSLVPLVVHVHERAIVRFAARPWSHDVERLDDPLTHITYPPVLRDRPDLDSDIPAVDRATYDRWLVAEGHDPAAAWARVHDALARTVLAGRDALEATSRRWMPDTRPAFELLGCDVLLDADLQPLLCEVNMSPSLTAAAGVVEETDVAATVKAPVLADLLDLLGAGPDGLSSDRPTGRVGGWLPLVPGPDPARWLPDMLLPRPEDLASMGGPPG